MWYKFQLFEENGEDISPADVALVYASNRKQAWVKADEYAYQNGYCDFGLIEEGEEEI